MNTGQTIRKGPQQMVTEGFYDLTSGDTNCLLQQTIFTAEVTVSGVTQTESFYTGTTLTDFPSDNSFYDVVKEMLLSYDGVGEVLLDYLENRITINTDCNSSVSLIDTDVNISLKISYDIDCQSCGPTTTTTTIAPTTTTTTSAPCFTYMLTVSGATSVEFLFNGCCANLGLNSLSISNTALTICSTTLPTTTSGGSVQLIGGCSC
jgi:hypothetical protein